MSLEFVRPLYLFGFALLVLFVWAYRHSLVDFSLRQRQISLAVRMALFSLIVLALAGLTLILPTHETVIVLLADHSRSVDSYAAERRDDFIDRCRQTIPPNRLGGIISFGTAGSTDIAGALNPALAKIPAGHVPHLILISDGNETQGNILLAAAQCGGIISTVPLPRPQEPEVQVTDMILPAQVRQGEPFYIDVVVQSNVETESMITLFKGASKLIEERKPLKIGENVFRYLQKMEEQQTQEFTVMIRTPHDTILDNNRLSRAILADGKPRVLMIDSEPHTTRDWVSALREQNIVCEVRLPIGLPKTLEDLYPFDAVLLSDVSATEMSQNQMNHLRTYVSELGGGLLMLGSENTFGLGGYHNTPVEEILPVLCHGQKEQEKPSLAMCLVIDRSGSMEGQKMELAKDAAKAAVELLTPQDFAAVIVFDNETYTISPMQSALALSPILSSISTIESAGGTNIYPAMVEAYEQLRQIPARLKHVILLTDGFSSPGDFEGITRQLTRNQITVSTVGVGEADNSLLKMIAEIGKGRHYYCDDPQAIPQIFAKETMTAGQSAIQELPFLPVQMTATTVLRQINMDSAPPLLGYVATKPKPTVEFILATETGDPLLTWWRFGLGQTAAFSSDAKNRWGGEWLGWECFGNFWAQVIRHIMRQPSPHGTTLEIKTAQKSLRLILESTNEAGQFNNEGKAIAAIIHPDLSKREWTLSQTAPGRYEAEIPLETAESDGYFVQTALQRGDQTVGNLSRSVMPRYSDELKILPTNETLLKQLAELSGGIYNPSAEEITPFQTDRTALKAVPLTAWLLTLAALLYVFDVLLRRIEIL